MASKAGCEARAASRNGLLYSILVPAYNEADHIAPTLEAVVSKLRLRHMGRRYLCTLVMIWFERLLILDDLMTERQGADAPPPPEA